MSRGVMRNWKAFTDQALTADANSDPTDLIFMDKGRAYIAWSGAVGGTATLDVEVSNDKVTWRSIMLNVITLTAGSGTHEMVFPEIDFSYLRFKILANAESGGTISINMNAQSEGR